MPSLKSFTAVRREVMGSCHMLRSGEACSDAFFAVDRRLRCCHHVGPETPFAAGHLIGLQMAQNFASFQMPGRGLHKLVLYKKVRDSSLLHEFYQWVRQMDVSESISYSRRQSVAVMLE
eukprot:Gb_34261 [translate_table: standard]